VNHKGAKEWGVMSEREIRSLVAALRASDDDKAVLLRRALGASW